MIDALSLLFDDLHLSAAGFTYLQGGERWKADISLMHRAVFYGVITGEVRLRFDDQDIQLTAGDIFALPTGTAHQISSLQLGPAVSINAHLLDANSTPVNIGEGIPQSLILAAACRYDPDLGQPLMSALPNGFRLAGAGQALPEWLRIGILFLQQEMNSRRQGQQSILNRLAEIWLLECLRDFIENLPESHSSWLHALHDPALARALACIHQAPQSGWTVSALASQAGLSRSAFADRFLKTMGQPTMAYLSDYRMRLAAWQLKNTSQPACRIAELVGYASEAAFGQAFKRHFGSSPGNYRLQFKQQT